MTEQTDRDVHNRPEEDNAAWLEQVQEDVLEPDLPIVDPHHHLWDWETHRYLLPDLLADLSSGHNVRASVYIEATAMYRADGPAELRSLGETEFVNGAAAMAASGRYGDVAAIAGIVGFVNLALGSRAEAVLEAHISRAPDRFAGVRHATAFEPSGAIRASHSKPTPELLADGRFREGFACLGKLGLSFDAWLFHHQIHELAALASVFPDQPIVLNHVGGPLGVGPYRGKQDEVFPVWRAAIQALANRENVYVKLGGLGMRINGFDFHKRPKPPGSEELAGIWAPYFETCIEAFGTQRCMFESNFPVDKVSGSYRVYWNAFKRIASGASEDEKAHLFHDTAAAFYKLG